MSMLGIGLSPNFQRNPLGGGAPPPPVAPAFVTKLPSTGAPADIYADFSTEGTTNQYWIGGVGTQASFAAWLAGLGGSFSRAGSVPYFNNGLLVQSASNVPIFPSAPGGIIQGLHTTPAQNELLLWNRDLTNAAWVASGITAAKDQSGIDGVANSCSSLTATAANGTILQTLTRAAARRVSAVWIHRITGSGAIQMTQDGGTTWATLTVPASFSQFSTGVTAVVSFANPVVGFRIVNAGDAIAVDFVAHRETPGSNPTNVLTPIATTTAASAATVPDLIRFPYSQTTLSALVHTVNCVFGGAAGAIVGGDVVTTWGITTNSQNGVTHYENGANLGGTGPNSVVNLQNLVKTMAAGNNSTRTIVTNNCTPGTSATPFTGTGVYSNLGIGSFGPTASSILAGDIARLAIWNNVIATNADMATLTT